MEFLIKRTSDGKFFNARTKEWVLEPKEASIWGAYNPIRFYHMKKVKELYGPYVIWTSIVYVTTELTFSKRLYYFLLQILGKNGDE